MLTNLYSVMFHHFHGGRHPRVQGSIDQEQLSNVIEFLDNNSNLVSATDFLDKAITHKLEKDDVCLTFDDGLSCQTELAEPVLRQHGLTGFFFVNSAPMLGRPILMEINRYFRDVCYKTIDHFYDHFFSCFGSLDQLKFDEAVDVAQKTGYLKEVPFYTNNDRLFRYCRDKTDTRLFSRILEHMRQSQGFEIESVKGSLWMSEDDMRELSTRGHEIGLHSFSHPTAIDDLSETEVSREYKANFRHLESCIGTPSSMSHPCGKYNDQILRELDILGIKLGFRSNPLKTNDYSLLELPRMDHYFLIETLHL